MGATLNDDAPTRVQPTGKRGGEWVTLGEEAYRIPPLGFRAVQELADDVASLQTMGARPTPEQMAVVVRIVHAAIVRNYPDMTAPQVDDMLDIGNYQQVLGAVLSIGGFTKGRAEPGEAPQAPIGAVSTPP